MFRFSRITLVLPLITLLAGCAAGGGTATKGGDKTEAQVGARAEARWKHVLANELPQAYEFLTPGYREAHDFDRYKKSIESRQLNWTAAELDTVQCDTPEHCKVAMKVSYSLIGGMPGVSDVDAVQVLNENWLKIGGAWYHLPSRALP